MAWFEFRQNNSGGSFDLDPRSGIGVHVWIEALDWEQANVRALTIGIYFDGCADGIDCDCCGDRWQEAWDSDGEEYPDINAQYDFSWDDAVYLHPLEGPFVVARSGNYDEILSRFIPASTGHA